MQNFHRAGIHTLTDEDGTLELSIVGDTAILRVGINDDIVYPLDGSADPVLIRTFKKFADMIKEASREKTK